MYLQDVDVAICCYSENNYISSLHSSPIDFDTLTCPFHKGETLLSCFRQWSYYNQTSDSEFRVRIIFSESTNQTYSQFYVYTSVIVVGTAEQY